MKTKAIAEQYKALEGLNDQQKGAILELIDLKTENDMQLALKEFKAEFATIKHAEATTQKLVWGVIITIAVAIVTAILLKFVQ